MIGIAMPSNAFKHELNHYHREDSILNQYKPLSQKYKVDLCMFSFKEIPQNSKVVEALVYSHLQNEAARKAAAVPRVNLVRNTGYVKDQDLIGKFEILRRQNIHFINFPVYLQANKYKNYIYLSSVNNFKSHVPHTKNLSYEQLKSFIKQYERVIIKPIYGSKGRGMTIIEKDDENYRICRTSYRKSVHSDSEMNLDQKSLSVPVSQLKQFYDQTFRIPASFLVQQWIYFKQLNGRPFDIRAVVQKNGKNRWQLTSRVARLTNKKGQITNLNQGGEIVSLSELNLNSYNQKIRVFSLGVAKFFEKLYPWTAEMGIDLGIDKKGKLWYIETNFCPEKTRWKTIFKIPFEYAYYIYKTGKRPLEGSLKIKNNF